MYNKKNIHIMRFFHVHKKNTSFLYEWNARKKVSEEKLYEMNIILGGFEN